MDRWRKKGDKFNQEFARTKPNHYRKPSPEKTSNWQRSIPLWEKRFCTSVGSLPWRKFLEAKEFTHLYDNIMKWDDAAGEEAFRNAKNRFYAKTHGLPCNIGLPDPDLYIDEIDWDSQVDQNLILELESDYVAPDANSAHEPVVIFGDVLPDTYRNYSPYGWGDADDNLKKAANAASPDNNVFNWDDYIDKEVDLGSGNTWWAWNENDNKAKGGDQGWSDDKNNHPGWDTYDDNNDSSHGHVNNERREGSGRYISRCKTSWFHGDDNQRSRSWRNNGNRRKPTAQGHGNRRIHVQP